MRRLALVSVICFSVAACGGATTQSGATRSGNRDVITLEEIESKRARVQYTWELIEQLRPHFLKSHADFTSRDTIPERATVYVDDIYHGPLESLKSLTVSGLKSIQFLSPYNATTRFGSPHNAGAILIRTN